LPEVIVVENVTVENRPGWLGEEQLVGVNQQPEWTTRRRFSTTRVYVLPPWQLEFEQWWKGKLLRDQSTSHLLQSELGIGLPYRFQLDLYENIERKPHQPLHRQGEQVEMRWAAADWGKIPLNPTLYGEWKFNDHDPDAYEVKLLLGDELASGWHWGVNLFFEQEVGGGRETESGFTTALSYSLVDEVLSFGIETKLERASGRNLDGKPSVEFLIGPSIQWRPHKRVHLDLVPLVGTTADSPRIEGYVVFGIDLGSKDDRRERHAPSSALSH
jgi:hypothetical protein